MNTTHFVDDFHARLFFERLMESLPDHVYFKDCDGRFVCINRAHAQYLGLKSPAEAVGRSDYDFFEESQARQKDADEREIVRSGVGFVDKEERATSVAGVKRWVLTSKLPLVGKKGEIIGTFGISREITEMKQARESLERQHRLMRTLIEILPCRIFVKDREGRLTLINEAYRRALGAGDADRLEGRRIDELVEDTRAAHVLADDRAVIDAGQEILNREEFDANPLGKDRWMLLSKVPLRDGDGQVQGLVGMAADITAQKEAEARALEAQRRLEEKNNEMEAELALARELQAELMASSTGSAERELDAAAPFHPTFGFHYEPSAHLAGDFYQVLPISHRSCALLLCDVMGHGVKAALVTTLIRGLVADLKADELSPGQVLERLNARLCPLLDRPPLPRFVTALYARIDTATGRLDLASAGHPWPLRGGRGHAPAPLLRSDCGPALGLISGANYHTVTGSISRGDRVLFHTDGWVEETNDSGEEFGRDRLLRLLAETLQLPPPEALKAMSSAVGAFSGREVRADDLCAVLTAFDRS